MESAADLVLCFLRRLFDVVRIRRQGHLTCGRHGDLCKSSSNKLLIDNGADQSLPTAGRQVPRRRSLYRNSCPHSEPSEPGLLSTTRSFYHWCCCSCTSDHTLRS